MRLAAFPYIRQSKNLYELLENGIYYLCLNLYIISSILPFLSVM